MYFYNKETDELIFKLFPGAESISKQRKGCSADYILQDGEVIEVKLDKRAADTGNLFVEFEYTNPLGTEPSGITLSADRGYSLVIFTGNNIYKMPAKDLLELAKRDKIKIVKTAPYRNGNREGVSASGYILPLSKLPDNWRFSGTK